MRKIIVLLMVLGLTAGSWAAPLTLDECVRLAREHYPAVAQYGLLERAAAYSLSNASKAWLPQGSLSAQATWQNDVATLPQPLTMMLAQQGLDYPGLDKTQYRVGADISQQIWDGGKTAASRHAVETGAEVERRSLDVQIYEVEGRVEELYFGLLLLDGRIDRADQSIAMVDSTLRQMRSMLANGVAMQSDCDQVEAKLLTLSQQRTQLATTRRSYQQILEIFIGEPLSERELQLPSNPIDNGIADGHPRLRLFDARINNIAAQADGIKASTMPHIGAFVSGYYGYPGYDMFENMRSHNPSFNFMAGVKVTWNFGALYTRGNSLDKLNTQRRQVEAERATFLFNNSIAENDLTLHRIELTKAIYHLNHIRTK